MRRAVLVVCDGHRADFVTPELTPNICALGASGRYFARHSSTFPSATRVASATIATGCHPGRHGLHGNNMALDEGGGLVVRDVGNPDFRARMRRATGATLRVPTLAQRVAAHGGQIAFSNVSPGAAVFQDPDGFGHVYHRDLCYGPGERSLTDPMAISHDAAGDRAMTARFCKEVLKERRPTNAVLWLCEPDHTMHASALGSPAHLQAVRDADACVGKVRAVVDALNASGDEVLLMVGSDHGQETISDTVHADAKLVEAGLKASLASTEVVVAPNGFSGLVYCAAGTGDLSHRVAEFLARQDWIGNVFTGGELGRVGMAADHRLSIAFTLRRSDATNSYGVPGQSLTVTAAGGKPKKELSSHGGLGRWEQHPFLVAYGSGVAPAGEVTTPTSIRDIAPTILAHLGLPADGTDGQTLILN